MGSISKPHVVMIPSSLQGHIKTMLKLAKLLHYKGFHITFVNTEFNHQRFLKSRGPDALDGLPHFRFETIPDGLPPSHIDSSQETIPLAMAVENNMLAPLKVLLAKLDNPPITCLVSDVFLRFTITAAEELGLPVVMLVTMSACGYMGFKQLHDLKEKGFLPLKDESYLTNGYLESTIIEGIPGMKPLQLKDYPYTRRIDPDDFPFNFVMQAAETSVKAHAIAIHTFDALEKDVLDGLSTIFPRVYSIGPLQLLLNQIQQDGLSSIGYNLWKEDSECLQWLDTKEPKSVVYVNFGSIAVMTAEQLVEFAMGLANSEISFLWIIRPDLVTGESAILPAEFQVETQNRCFVTSWCPQEEVLNHPSVGGFLTHTGWNSIIESLCAGVPVICWPLFADQPINCSYACVEWGVGMEIDNNVRREDVEKLIRNLMGGEECKKMRERAEHWKQEAEEATVPNGSSSINLDRFINEMLQSNITL
ncbi:PREDICTED: 7-deoxyloganetin glucosyltransferase-like isoform X2 [Populus euphratica]|uniref:Glycosyltransferase n=1 Tax=Populus euphratica TaxID=75702 RepID=A0AAJ6TEZ2_POPEU|nr:PREDICTED: 7-deoxyloganetin glucosyltransferase-like isoform X2 [Populus euphratica]